MVEDGRIELPLHACKAHVLPLSLIPQYLVSVGRIELPSHGPKPRILPLNYTEKNWCPIVESNYGLMLTRQLLYHLTKRAIGGESGIRTPYT